jgi:L-alanine-DL-glutamate epimerase-like enolase superfamily enzyme
MVNRRHFLAALAASTAAPAAANRITGIRVAPIEGRFHKFVTINAYDKTPKGHTYSNHLIRVATSQGVEGVGVMGYRTPDDAFYQALKSLVGADPLALYQVDGGRITGRAAAYATTLRAYPFLDGALFDLIGKLTGKAAWRLIGESARDRVEVYDGTLYFSDVWFRDRGVKAVVEEAEEAMKAGYRGIKLKIGRGWKWMEPEPGFRRDVEVIHAVRRAVGRDCKVLVDANNGYQKEPERAWRLLEETAADKLYWLEEPYPEDVALYTKLRARMRQAGMKTLIADGESVRDVRELEPFIAPEMLVDALQMDIRTCGILENVALARRVAGRATVVPHNWGSHLGVLMGLQVAKAVAAIPAAEDDRSTCDVLRPEGYEFHGGSYSVPDRPGLSVTVDEEVYKMKCKSAEVAIA